MRPTNAPGVSASYRETILQKLGQGLSAQRIFQDLREEHDFGHGYDSVKRYVRHLRGGRMLPFRRMECSPGEEAHAPRVTSEHFSDDSAPKNSVSGQVLQASPAQVDFGTRAPL